ncbi:MAG: 3-phosphoshikimate 1-carboxyvinyltransferase [Candidatus Omnitrophica bacterium]|nr:3-phosphoshikimate 1-carboxyvinyltransferase [Candidatus Omnitrophota bacterium]
MYTIKPLSSVKKQITVPPDKSISHRAVILSSLCSGKTTIKPFIESDDILTTLNCMKKLGVGAKLTKKSLTISGTGMYFKPKLKKIPVSLYAAESGTTMRILSGLLCSQKFTTIFEAAPSLSKRPMERVVAPLKEMGAIISGVSKESAASGKKDIYPPLRIEPAKKIISNEFMLEVASAQIKSAIMLAALYAKGKTIITEPYRSRDHTERMLKLFGANIIVKDTTVTCQPVKHLVSPGNLLIPGDFSSAAFFIVLGLILRNSRLIIKDVNINPTRCGLLNVLKRMGANIKITNEKNTYEPYADIIVESSQLKAAIVEPDEVPSMIDEIPVLCVASSFAEGKTQIKGVKELRVKETDRVRSMIVNLSKAGVDIYEESYGNDLKIVIAGKRKHKACNFESFHDHRTAMSMIIFAMALEDGSRIDDTFCINKSFPEFISLVKSLYK